MSEPRNYVCACGHAAAEHARIASPLHTPTLRSLPCLVDGCDCRRFLSEIAALNELRSRIEHFAGPTTDENTHPDLTLRKVERSSLNEKPRRDAA